MGNSPCFYLSLFIIYRSLIHPSPDQKFPQGSRISPFIHAGYQRAGFLILGADDPADPMTAPGPDAADNLLPADDGGLIVHRLQEVFRPCDLTFGERMIKKSRVGVDPHAAEEE